MNGKISLLDEGIPGTEIVISVNLNNMLFEGDYFISVGIASSDTSGEVIPHDRRYDSIHIASGPVKKFTGLTDLNARINFER